MEDEWVKTLEYTVGIMGESTSGTLERRGFGYVPTTQESLVRVFLKLTDEIYKFNDGQLFQDDSIKITVTLEYVPEDK